MDNSILTSLHHLIYNNIFCSDPLSVKWSGFAVNGFEKRAIGFRAEAEFKQCLLANSAASFDGGWLLPNIGRVNCLYKPIYYTVSKDEPEKYLQIYNILSNLKPVRLFFIKYNWLEKKTFTIPFTEIKILVPNLICYEYFNKEFHNVTCGEFGISAFLKLYSRYGRYRSQFELPHKPGEFLSKFIGAFSDEIGLDILSNRIIIDGFLGMNVTKGKPADIDMILLSKNGTYLFIETKEKDQSKRPPKGFGMDVPRINDILVIQKTCKVKYIYVVKEVNNQIERKHVSWKAITMDRFLSTVKGQATIDGGTGMATAKDSEHPTLVAPYSEFTTLTDFSNITGFLSELT